MELRLDGDYVFTSALAPSKYERSPELEFYLSADMSRKVVCVSLGSGVEDEVSGTLHMHIKLPATCTLPLSPAASLNVDCFTEVQNHLQEWCRIKSGSCTLLLQPLYEHNQSSPTRMEFTLGMPTDNNFVKGMVILQVKRQNLRLMHTSVGTGSSNPYKGGSAQIFRAPIAQDYIPQNFGMFKRVLSQNITGSMDVFERMRPSWPIISSLHAPYFKSRVGPLPGPAYAMFHHPVSSEAFYVNVLGVALHRRGMSMEEFLKADTSRASLILAETVCVYANYCPYMPDVVNRNRRHTHTPYRPSLVKPIESFDIMRTRDSGDCEDSACEIAMELDELARGPADGKGWKTPGIQRLQKLRHLYVPVMALAGVTSAAITGGRNVEDINTLEDIGGHMYTMLWPLDYTLQCMERQGVATETLPKHIHALRGETKDLEMLVLEGTGKFSPVSERDPVLSERRYIFQGTGRLFSVFKNTLYHDRSAGPSSFYKTETSVFTNEFMRHGQDFAELVLVQHGSNGRQTYGVTFMDTVAKSDRIGLLPQPKFTAEELQCIDAMMHNEHPVPALDAPSGGQRVSQEAFHPGLERLRAVLNRSSLAQPQHTQTVEMYVRDFELTPEHLNTMERLLGAKQHLVGMDYRHEPITDTVKGYALQFHVTQPHTNVMASIDAALQQMTLGHDVVKVIVEGRTFQDVQDAVTAGRDGFVNLGVPEGDDDEQYEGLLKFLVERQVVDSVYEGEQLFDTPYIITTTGGRRDLVMPLREDATVNMSRLAMARMAVAGFVKWMSDYVVNYADQH